jgi:peptide/nickel transport system substrate-binding protein
MVGRLPAAPRVENVIRPEVPAVRHIFHREDRMGERSVFRDVIIIALLVALVVQAYVLIRQNQHDVADRMQKIVDGQKEQDVTVRSVRDTLQQQSDVLKEMLAELKKPGRTIVVPNGGTEIPTGPVTVDSTPAGDKRAEWEKAYIDPAAEKGGTLYRAFLSDPGTMNPLTENDATVSDVHQYISEGLATRDYKNLDLWMPELATHWEETQTSWALPAKGDAQEFVSRINSKLSADAKNWIKASVEKDGRLRLDIAKLGEGYQKALNDIIAENELMPIQWIAATFVPTAGEKDLPEQKKVMERFNASIAGNKDIKLPGDQVWVTENGFIFRLPGDKAAAETLVRNFLAQKEQQGPNGAVWNVTKTDTYTYEDNLFFTFHLRPNVRWHDGTALTVKDYLFSFKALKDPGVDCQPKRNYYQDCVSLDAPDASTLRFTWRKLQANAFVASAGLTLLPEHIFKYENANELNTNKRNTEAFGTGPYRLKEWQKKQRIVLERNENYWGLKPNFDRVYFRIVSESAVRLQMLKDKKIDFSGMTPPQWQNDTKKPPFNEPGGLLAIKQYDLYYNYIGWNARQPQLADKRVRRALTMSINREGILKDLLYNLGAVVSGTFYHKSPYTNPDIKPWPYDLDAAAKLFEEAGWKDTDGDGYLDKDGKRFEVKIRFPAASETGKKILIAVQSDLKKAKVFCELDPIEWSVFLTRIKKREFDAIMLGWSLGWDPDPYQLWHSSQSLGEGSNHCYFVNKEADEIIEKLRKTFDLQERIRLCNRFHSILHEEQPYTFMFNSMALIGHNADIKNMYLPLKPGEEREQYIPFEGDHTFTRFWYLPRVNQQLRD